MLTGPLAARFQVIAVDYRGARRSAKPPGRYSIEQMAADVAGLMDRLGLPRAHTWPGFRSAGGSRWRWPVWWAIPALGWPSSRC